MATKSSAVAVGPRDASCHWIFSKSLKVVHCSEVYVCFSHRFWNIQRQIMTWLWKWVRGRSRSIKMAPFDRPLWRSRPLGHCKYSSILYDFRVNLRWIISWPFNLGQRSLRVTQGYWNWYHSKAWVRFPISSEIKRDIGRIFIPLCIRRPVRGVPVGILPYRWVCAKTRMVWLPDRETFEDMCTVLTENGERTRTAPLSIWWRYLSVVLCHMAGFHLHWLHLDLSWADIFSSS